MGVGLPEWLGGGLVAGLEPAEADGDRPLGWHRHSPSLRIARTALIIGRSPGRQQDWDDGAVVSRVIFTSTRPALRDEQTVWSIRADLGPRSRKPSPPEITQEVA